MKANMNVFVGAFYYYYYWCNCTTVNTQKENKLNFDYIKQFVLYELLFMFAWWKQSCYFWYFMRKSCSLIYFSCTEDTVLRSLSSFQASWNFDLYFRTFCQMNYETLLCSTLRVYKVLRCPWQPLPETRGPTPSLSHKCNWVLTRLLVSSLGWRCTKYESFEMESA